MEAGWQDLLKLWGPLALGWPVAFMLFRELQARDKSEKEQYKAMVDSQAQLAISLTGLTKAVEKIGEKNGR